MLTKEVLSQIPANEECYFLLDCGAFLIPYLKYRIITYNKSNITPFIKIIELFFNTTDYARKSKFLFFIDNGVPDKIKALYPNYKAKRKHSRHRSESAFISADIMKSNDYVLNRTMICRFFTLLGQGAFYYSEADYQLGYVLHKLINEYNVDKEKIYIVSHDNDLISMLEFANCIHMHRKDKHLNYDLYKCGDYEKCTDGLNVYSYDEYIIMKALRGDDVDNITAPILVKERFVKDLFNKYKFDFGYAFLDIQKTFEIISNKLLKKIKDSTQYDKINEMLAHQLRRNYLIFDVYNSDSILNVKDKRFIDVVLSHLCSGSLKANYNEAYETLRRISISYADIFKKWLQRTNKL